MAAVGALNALVRDAALAAELRATTHRNIEYAMDECESHLEEIWPTTTERPE